MRTLLAGYTLVESMIASTLLSVSVVGVSGTVLSSYAHDVQSKQQSDAVRAAESLKNELTALPMEAAIGDTGLMDFANYSDTAAPNQNKVATAAKSAEKEEAARQAGLLGTVVGTVVGILGGLLGGGSSSSTSSGGTTTTTTTTTTEIAKDPTLAISSMASSRTVSVERRSTLTGAVAPAGELAFVTIDVAVGNGQTVRLKRLVTTTEAASNANGGRLP